MNDTPHPLIDTYVAQYNMGKSLLDGQAQASLRWLEDYARKVGIPYDNLIDLDADSNSDFQPPGEFWYHWEIVTGKDSEEEGRYFRCGC